MHKKEIPELCDELVEILTNFYETKYEPLKIECQRYRKTAQELLKKNRNLEARNESLQAENKKLQNRIEFYKDLYLKEKSKQK